MQVIAAANPFRFGALALDEAFADREAEVAELVADVGNGQDVVVLAPRRYGKSSLVWRAVQELGASGVLVAEVDLMTAPSKEKLAERLARSIFENVASALERAREAALAPFRGLRIQPTVTVSPVDGSFSFSFAGARRREDIDATLEHLLELPAELGASRGRRVAVVLDEFQEIVAIDPGLPKLLRSVFQRQPEVAHVYLGSRRHVMERIFNDENEPFWRSAKAVELGVIEPERFAPFIAERFRGAGKAVAPEVIDWVLAETGGHPYATQELCYFLFEETAAGATSSLADAGRALAGVVRSEHAHFSLLWEGASSAQKLVLEALAEGPGRPFGAEYRRIHGLPPATNVQRALRTLVDRELVANDGGAYSISEPFLAEWIERNVGGRDPGA
jgi:hypothetical protein